MPAGASTKNRTRSPNPASCPLPGCLGVRIQLSHPSWTCHQPWLLAQRVTAVSLVRKIFRCDQSTSLPEGALDDDPMPPYLLQEMGTPVDASCRGCPGRGLCTNQPQLTSLAWRLLQGCSHTVETRFGAHFQFHIPKRSSFLRWVFFPFMFNQKLFFYSEPSTSRLRNPGILILSKCAGTAQAWSAGGWAAGRAGHPWDCLVSWTGCLSFTLTRHLLPAAQVQRAKLPMEPGVVSPGHHLLPLPVCSPPHPPHRKSPSPFSSEPLALL